MTRNCRYCNAPIKNPSGRKLYCCKECRLSARKIRQKALHDEEKRRKAGKPTPINPYFLERGEILYLDRVYY